MAEDPGTVRASIEATRAELADTIEALGEKADVKGRVAAAARDQKDAAAAQLHAAADHLGEAVPEAIGRTAGATAKTARRTGRATLHNRRPVALALLAALVVVLAWAGIRRAHSPAR